MKIEKDMENRPAGAGWSGGCWPGDQQPILGHPGPPSAASEAWMEAEAGRCGVPVCGQVNR
jgi:hypothetical protein